MRLLRSSIGTSIRPASLLQLHLWQVTASVSLWVRSSIYLRQMSSDQRISCEHALDSENRAANRRRSSPFAVRTMPQRMTVARSTAIAMSSLERRLVPLSLPLAP